MSDGKQALTVSEKMEFSELPNWKLPPKFCHFTMMFSDQSSLCQATNGQPSEQQPMPVQSPMPSDDEPHWSQLKPDPIDEIPYPSSPLDPNICISPAPDDLSESPWFQGEIFDLGFGDLDSEARFTGFDDIDNKCVEATRKKCQFSVPQAAVIEPVCPAFAPQAQVPAPKMAMKPRGRYGDGIEAQQLQAVNKPSDQLRKYKSQVTKLVGKLTVPMLKDIANRATAQNMCRKPRRIETRGQWCLWGLFMERYPEPEEFANFVKWLKKSSAQ